MRIAIDVMGADYSPVEQIMGAVLWQAEHPEDELLLVGDEAAITAELEKQEIHPGRIRVVPATQVITMNEHPAAAVKAKKDASILVATRLVKAGEAEAVVSCGNTGAQMASAVFTLGRLKNVDRPPLLTELPGKNPHAILDIGANVDCPDKQLVQFAVLGCAYMQAMKKTKRPRIALLSNGAEEKKGNAIVQAAHQILKNQTALHFVGNVEGRDLFADDCPEVVVCDGFCGNLVLKALEGALAFAGKACLKEFGGLPGAFAALDHNQRGGVPLLGVKGVSIVCHGNSKRQAVTRAIQVARECVNDRLVQLQQETMEQLQIK